MTMPFLQTFCPKRSESQTCCSIECRGQSSSRASIDLSSRDCRKLASRLCDWTVFVKEVDQTTKALILSIAPFAEDDYHSSELLESIARISERQPNEAH